ncbi:MAG: hypothetical protein K8F91_07020 [Candidatus Obscuribacterales bacterium]|nr:hypothetical protein [Candidatus Obscuribacterales bacterium]
MKWHYLLLTLGLAASTSVEAVWSFNPPGPRGGAGHAQYWHYNPPGPSGGPSRCWVYKPPARHRARCIKKASKHSRQRAIRPQVGQSAKVCFY